MFTYRVDKEINLIFLQHSMADSLYELVDANREYLKEWMPWVANTNSPDDIKAFIERSINGFSKNESLVCGIEYQETLVGIISFNKISKELKKVVLGYWIAEQMQGRGIITRCCNSLIEYAFDEMEMQKVEIRSASDNTKSRSVCDRLGFTLEGVVSNSENINGRIVDHAVYGIHKET